MKPLNKTINKFLTVTDRGPTTGQVVKGCIGLATKSFRFLPLDDFSRSKSFFSIAIFKPYMVFDSYRFIDYSVKKSFKFCCYLLLCIDLKWRFQAVISVTFYFITSEKVKTQCKLEKSCMMFLVKNH